MVDELSRTRLRMLDMCHVVRALPRRDSHKLITYVRRLINTSIVISLCDCAEELARHM